MLVAARYGVLLVIIAAAGCSKPGGDAAAGGTKSLAGDWAATSTDAKSVLRLAEDGSATMIVGNSFATGVLEGRFSQSGDRLTLELASPGEPTPMKSTYRYRWISPTKMALKSDAPGGIEAVYTLAGKAAKTAKLTTGSVPGSVPPKDSMQTTCLSNIKQVAMASVLYSQDYDETLPTATTWATSLYPYAKNATLFSCPTLIKAGKKGGFAMDSRLSGLRTATIQNPRDTVLFFESTTEALGASDPQTSLLRKSRHDGKVNFALADGHAQALAAP
ncbi:H-X9-DG-CTERM domain-containing protein [Fimbriimonas ginsengisoli]|uniref:Lipoprotein n=1 Tax=Fimbriimonas ginsengisoli Gsoil 348 TaxID=661478 RepID=A0A068NSA2_FIMGI|nr:H-X9-DG-CTERM domain-containing protein [Fimbriimonas ginsengisoli]AIE86227.1 hypothetical protein OP10G_2859 [Fimbriimonas ginsengisoli Gsoil 348]